MQKIIHFLLLMYSPIGFSQLTPLAYTKTSFKQLQKVQDEGAYNKHLEAFRSLKLYKENEVIYGAAYLEANMAILDFDGDGLMDLIYEGYLDGGETEYIVVFHRSQDGFVQLVKLAGYPVHVSDPNLSENFYFTIKNYGCCQDVVSVLESYSLINLENQPTLILTRKFSFLDMESASFPSDYFNEPIQFETTSSRYTLRASPEIDDR